MTPLPLKRVSIICDPSAEEHVAALLEEIGAEGHMTVPVRGIDPLTAGTDAETTKLQIETTLDSSRADTLLHRLQSDLLTASSSIAAYESDVPEEEAACSHVTTAEEQARLTPDEVLQQFKDGNRRFRSGQTTRRNHPEQVRKSAVGQYPKAVVLSCLDSRVPVEDVFDQGIGDVFVARVAGNLVNEDILGSMEFACKVAGAKMILVMGHQHCGAISANPLYVRHVARNNVRHALSQIRTQSPILKEMEDKKEIKIVGAFYRLTDGTLEFIE
ncbi:carbonic anhydrase [Prosthecobacter sp.]|uniref:carbonic anhydrase n=1 Tax=Prosthecobacter sp. TaxID=1965333 RepID=UPI003783BB16